MDKLNRYKLQELDQFRSGVSKIKKMKPAARPCQIDIPKRERELNLETDPDFIGWDNSIIGNRGYPVFKGDTVLYQYVSCNEADWDETVIDEPFDDDDDFGWNTLLLKGAPTREEYVKALIKARIVFLEETQGYASICGHRITIADIPKISEKFFHFWVTAFDINTAID